MTWETGLSIVEYGLRRANELKIDQNDDFVADYKDYCNLAYWDIIGEFPWLWAMKYPPYQLTTMAPIAVSGATVAGSVTVTLAADPGVVAGCKLVFESDGIPMRILSSVGAVLTLAAGYPIDNASVTGFIYKDEYAIPADVVLPTMLKRLASGGEIEPLTNDLFTASYGRNITGGNPQSYTYLTEGIVQLGRWPMTVEVLELWYVYLPPALDFSGSAATDTPIVPINLRWIISDRALFYLLTDMEDQKGEVIIKNASARLIQEKDRHAARWRPRFWIPQKFRVARNR